LVRYLDNEKWKTQALKTKKLFHARLNPYLEKVKTYQEARLHQNKQAGYKNKSDCMMSSCVNHGFIPDYYKNALR
jgi:hypothetical protein